MICLQARSLTLLGLLAGLSACATTVVGGGSGGGGTAGDGGGGTGGGSVTIPAVTTIAERAADAAIAPADIDPATLLVRAGNYGVACGGTDSAVGACTSTKSWQLQLAIPPSGQAPGIHQLSEPGYFVSFSESQGGGNGECSGGGGTMFDGTVEIVSIDEASIVVRLEGVMADYDGVYVAAMCP